MNTGKYNSCLCSRTPELCNMILLINTQEDFTKVTPLLKQHFTMSLGIYVYSPRTSWATATRKLIITQLHFDCDCQNCCHWEFGKHSKNVFENFEDMFKWVHAQTFELTLTVLRAGPGVLCCAWANTSCWKGKLWLCRLDLGLCKHAFWTFRPVLSCTNCARAVSSPMQMCSWVLNLEFQNTGKLRWWLLCMRNPAHRFLVDLLVSPYGLSVLHFHPF